VYFKMASGKFLPVLSLISGITDSTIFSATYNQIGRTVNIQIRAGFITNTTTFEFKIQKSSLPIPVDPSISGFIVGAGIGSSNSATFSGGTYGGQFRITGTSHASGMVDASIFGVYYCAIDLLRDAFANAVPSNKLAHPDMNKMIAADSITRYFKARIKEPFSLNVSKLKMEDIIAISDRFESLYFKVELVDSILTAIPS